MYAAVINLRIDPQHAPAAAAAFTRDILPGVTSAEGFVRGYWLDPVETESLGFLVFETAEQARGATPPATDWSAPGVRIVDVKVRRVAVAVS